MLLAVDLLLIDRLLSFLLGRLRCWKSRRNPHPLRDADVHAVVSLSLADVVTAAHEFD